MALKRITVHLSVQQASRLRLLVKRHREAETKYANGLTAEWAEGLSEPAGTGEWERAVRALRRQARMEAARVRPVRWPSLDVLMGRALEARLQVPDVAGPWLPLTREERQRLSLSGRWPASVSGCEHGTVERAFSLDEGLVLRLRTAAWRVSEPVLQELEAKGLTGPRRDLSDEARAERERLAVLLYPSSRIAREAVEYHWPTSDEEDLNE
ncbi:hypothetical protein [Streptomyces nanshensis]|uniref:Uncharacterized protein n=1 Tax=Streptomyces nanshensis TaxID=518642 RepID=A0A1E7L9Z1_9ACTN|nr:hypothetical protein [Streptomyces nanshensis]OEV12974.1 hypothetical protein AN218_05535 [Streptomyces nanshensis]